MIFIVLELHLEGFTPNGAILIFFNFFYFLFMIILSFFFSQFQDIPSRKSNIRI